MLHQQADPRAGCCCTTRGQWPEGRWGVDVGASFDQPAHHGLAADGGGVHERRVATVVGDVDVGATLQKFSDGGRAGPFQVGVENPSNPPIYSS